MELMTGSGSPPTVLYSRGTKESWAQTECASLSAHEILIIDHSEQNRTRRECDLMSSDLVLRLVTIGPVKLIKN
jgi:hypothetical protein